VKNTLQFLHVIVFTIFLSTLSCKSEKSTGPDDTVGPDETLLIEESDPVTDYDGNSYRTVRIGNQIWMAENLKSTHYSDGSQIQSFAYNNDTSMVSIYGRVYIWSAFMRNEGSSNANPSGVQGASPEGWHIPSDSEWQELINNLGGEAVAGGRLKAVGLEYWVTPNRGATNESLMGALPTGFRDFTGDYSGLGRVCFFGTASAENAWEVYIREVNYTRTSIPRGGLHPDDAVPVRCLKNP